MTSPASASPSRRQAHLADVGYWKPHVDDVLKRHQLGDVARDPVAGFNPTYPTFLCGDVVVKLFGGHRAWRRAHAAERGALCALAGDPEIAAPRLLAEGWLRDDVDPSWPYLVTTRVPGLSWEDAGLSLEQKRSLAADLGRQVRRVHALPVAGVSTVGDWSPVPVAEAAARSSLPPHLVAQVDDYLARLDAGDRVVVHADLCAMHAFVDDGRLTGIIDWGDALSTDRHCEIIQLYRSTFACDPALLQVFLEACDWPVARDFPDRVLGQALRRQALGLSQHHSMDVFEPIAAAFPLGELATLDELARELFGF